MKKNLVSLRPWLTAIPQLLVQALETNFRLLNEEEGPFAIAVDYTMTAVDKINSVQASAALAAMTVYLPVQPVGNRRRTITKIDSSGNAVTVSGNGSLINGSSTYALAAQYDSVTVEPTGTGWLAVAVFP